MPDDLYQGKQTLYIYINKVIFSDSSNYVYQAQLAYPQPDTVSTEAQVAGSQWQRSCIVFAVKS